MVTRILMAACVAMLMMLASRANAETVVPTQGQTPEQFQADTAGCQAQATSVYDQTLVAANQSAATSTTSASAPSGGRERGAAPGGAADAALAGAVVGGSRQRQDRRQQAQSQQQVAPHAAVS
jgi:hypothetical protein